MRAEERVKIIQDLYHNHFSSRLSNTGYELLHPMLVPQDSIQDHTDLKWPIQAMTPSLKQQT